MTKEIDYKVKDAITHVTTKDADMIGKVTDKSSRQIERPEKVST